MRYLSILLLLLLMGCASTLTVAPDGSVTASDYTVVIKSDGTRTYTPNRWFTTGAISNLFGTMLPIVGK